MTLLSTEVFNELCAILGAAYVNRDDNFLASHDWVGIGGSSATKTLLGNPPGAIVLPSSTEEVAAVVKTCVKHGIKFKAHSTGYGNLAGVGTAGSVCIDLRRMNRLQIDAANQMAILEPYVTAGQLLAEARKVGLFCHVIGAGPVHSPLASATSFCGVGLPGNFTSNNARNLLSLEWVTPMGEIVRIGSAGSGEDWFTGEGPGPGFRGILRGVLGSLGGLGVFTKIGYKLHPWSGPQKMELTGRNPLLGMRLPPNFKFHQVAWDSWEAMSAATFEFNAANIVTVMTRIPPDCVGLMLTKTNREYYDSFKSGQLPPVARSDAGYGWSMLLTAYSDEEIKYKEEVFDAIVHRTGGREVPTTQEEQELLALTLTTSIHVGRSGRRGMGGGTSMGVLDSFALLPKVAKLTEELMEDPLAKGWMINAHPDQNWMWPSEGRHFWTENAPNCDRTDLEATAGNMEYTLASFNKADQRGGDVGISAFLIGDAADLYGPGLGHVNDWMRKTKNAFDPQNLSDSKAYIQPEMTTVAKVWPLAKKFLFRPAFKSVLHNAMKRLVT